MFCPCCYPKCIVSTTSFILFIMFVTSIVLYIHFQQPYYCETAIIYLGFSFIAYVIGSSLKHPNKSNTKILPV